jgi:hypothetical protein
MTLPSLTANVLASHWVVLYWIVELGVFPEDHTFSCRIYHYFCKDLSNKCLWKFDEDIDFGIRHV